MSQKTRTKQKYKMNWILLDIKHKSYKKPKK